jgi:hypothetical protein
MTGSDAERGAKRGVPGTAAVEAEDEVDGLGPDLEVGEDAVQGRTDVGSHLAAGYRVVVSPGSCLPAS